MVIASLVESSNTNWGHNGFLLITNSTNEPHIKSYLLNLEGKTKSKNLPYKLLELFAPLETEDSFAFVFFLFMGQTLFGHSSLLTLALTFLVFLLLTLLQFFFIKTL